MWRFAFLWIAAPLLAQQSVDLVLAMDATPGMQRSLSAAIFRPDPADRVAVLAFTSKSRLAQNFTNDPRKLTAAIEGLGRRSVVPVSFGIGPSPNAPTVRLFQALLDAARLFRPLPVAAGRQRVIVAFFGTEDQSSSPLPEDVKLALSSAQITVFGIAVARHDDHSASDWRAQTPPTLPGTSRVPDDLAPLPEATMERLAIVGTVVRGGSGDGSILDVLKRVRYAQGQDSPLR